jgi:hypothetical protein
MHPTRRSIRSSSGRPPCGLGARLDERAFGVLICPLDLPETAGSRGARARPWRDRAGDPLTVEACRGLELFQANGGGHRVNSAAARIWPIRSRPRSRARLPRAAGNILRSWGVTCRITRVSRVIPRGGCSEDLRRRPRGRLSRHALLGGQPSRAGRQSPAQPCGRRGRGANPLAAVPALLRPDVLCSSLPSTPPSLSRAGARKEERELRAQRAIKSYRGYHSGGRRTFTSRFARPS